MKPGAETEKGMKWKRKGEDILKTHEEKREAKMEREMLLKLPCLGNKKKRFSIILKNDLQTTFLDHNIAEWLHK